MAKQSAWLKNALAEWDKEYYRKRRPFYVDAERNSFELFKDVIEFGDCYPENEDLAIKIIDILRRRYNLLF